MSNRQQPNPELPRIKISPDFPVAAIDTDDAFFGDAYAMSFNDRFAGIDDFYNVTTRTKSYFASPEEDTLDLVQPENFEPVEPDEGYIDITGKVIAMKHLVWESAKVVIPALIIYNPRERITTARTKPLKHPDGHLLQSIHVDLRSVHSPITLQKYDPDADTKITT